MIYRGSVTIDVEQTATGDPMVFSVSIKDRGASSHHRVTLSRASYDHFTAGAVEPAECVRAAFRFLLERESPGDILPSFDVNVIKMYFPHFERDFPAYLDPGAGD